MNIFENLKTEGKIIGNIHYVKSQGFDGSPYNNAILRNGEKSHQRIILENNTLYQINAMAQKVYLLVPICKSFYLHIHEH